MWFIGVEVEPETSATPPKKTPVSAPDFALWGMTFFGSVEMSIIYSLLEIARRKCLPLSISSFLLPASVR